MARRRGLRVLVATDGSRHARAAITTTLHFPWPDGTRVRVVSARRMGTEYERPILSTALERGAEMAADSARRTLSRRWPDVETVTPDASPVDGILQEADRFQADVIVVGWRGRGPVRRLLMGSVSRDVARGAKCAVLVVRRSQRVRRIVIGFDGSATAKRAMALVGRLTPPKAGRVTLVTAVELIAVPSPALVRDGAAAAREVRRRNTIRARTAMKGLNRAAAELERAGWQVQTVLVHGEPLRDLLGAAAETRAQLVVVGARGTSRVRYLLLGSVAEGTVHRCPGAVLVAR